MALDYDEKLAEIAKQMKKGVKPQSVSVRDFIAWFGVQRRSFLNVNIIRVFLEKHQVITKPDFDSVYIDSPISFQLQQKGMPAEGQSQSTAEVFADPTYRIGRLAAANKRPLSVKPDDLLSEAVALMISHDYSQLPVMTNDRDVKGMVSWTSIGSRLALGRKCTHVRDCMEAPKEISADTYLLAAINDIVTNQYVLIRDSEKVISGIVTTSDLSLQFHQLGEPFILLGEIENYVRRMTQEKFTLEELKEACDPSSEIRVVQSVFDLTFGEYLRLLENPARWNKLGLSVDRSQFIKQLDEIRRIRNDVMHFDPDGIADEDLKRLRQFARLMRGLANIGVI